MPNKGKKHKLLKEYLKISNQILVQVKFGPFFKQYNLFLLHLYISSHVPSYWPVIVKRMIEKTEFVTNQIATGNQISRTDKGLVEKEESTDFIYQKQKKMQNGEQTTSYAFYQKQEKNIIYATVSQTTASMTGSMFTQEVYYKGKQMGWYLLFNETIDMDGAVQSQLEQPVIVFANGSQGVIINGESYKKVSNSF